ncbi:hypothetical protein [Bradyrhizobium glycinis]|uniref:hypothetical protein n=1 Tax=Bradyrhizobium glycinis TaxID=2751812 RepID=UPI0018D7414C|nr:hypothetical protein [Bradyrhizobium glycinis]MBH5372815.1 hypothetical protein [Bradyrhizobium glycinis]
MPSHELLRRHSFAKSEFADQLRGANIAIAFASEMVAAGKLTKREFREYEAHLWHQMLDELPVEQFSEMMKDGSLEELEKLARGYDDRRDSHDVLEQRKAIERKVKADALEQKWLEGKIDSKTYAQLSREHVGRSERLDKLIADEDHEGAALEAFGDRYGDSRDLGSELERYLNERYGSGTKPDGRKVEPFSLKRDDRSNWEKATDDDGITDLDMLADLDRGEVVGHHPNGYVEHDTVLHPFSNGNQGNEGADG